MFINKQTRGYYSTGGEQHSGRGDYLALFSWNKFKAADAVRATCVQCQCAAKAYAFRMNASNYMYTCGRYESGSDVRRAWEQAYNAMAHCAQHDAYSVDGPTYANGKDKLWAIVRSCALQQCGQFMMGTIRIGGVSITVSGPCGHDGLPLDLQELPASQRARLVEVPENVAAIYWADNGHNDVGSTAASALRNWAREYMAQQTGVKK